MPNAITSTGITTATQSELYNQLVNAYKSIYGTDINVASDTPDGQQINIYVQATLDVLNLVTQVFNSFDPDLAIGAVLDQRCAINGIQRQAATFTLTNVTVTTSQIINLYGLDQATQPVYTVADAAGNQWQLVQTQLNLPIGANVLTFQAANPGPVHTTVNTITVPVSVVLGVTSVNNPNVAISVGIAEESDLALRTRRAQSVNLQSQGYLKGLLAALENINGISSANVYENNTSSTDANGIPGHSIWVVVSGNPTVTLSTAYNSLTTYSYGQIASYSGSNYISVANNNTGNTPASSPLFWELYNPIPWAIYNYRNAGCGLKGANSYNLTQIDGSNFTVLWDTVTQVEPFIKLQAGSINKINPPNVAGIISYLQQNYVPAAGEELNINQITALTPIADPNALILFTTGYGFSSSSGGTYTYTLSPAALNDQFQIAASNIIVLPIALSCPNGVLVTDSNGLQTGLTISVPHGGSILFSAIGGYGTLTWSGSGLGSGGFTPSTGASSTFTFGSAGAATVTITDSLGNTTTANVTVT